MLVDCPECGREVSDRAPACPVCGFPLDAMTTEATSKRWKRLVLWGVGGVFWGIGFTLLGIYLVVPWVTAAGLVLVLASVGCIFSARFAAWWHHG